jgi:hypothetical protein
VTQKGTRDLEPDIEITFEQDLRNEIVTAEAAERDYGVSITSDGVVSRLVSV